MKSTLKTFALIGLLGLSSLASALEIQAYSPQAFAALQVANQPVALHFHADWCSTCKAQEKIFKGWKGDASVPGTLLIVNYDQERVLRREMKVRMQSTVVSFKGTQEKARVAGDTDPQVLKGVLEAAR
ncbi:MAG: thioredoxin family protein [Dechloromonas sp.]|nr:thioredoxin family protein [Dechloromonas sp.]